MKQTEMILAYMRPGNSIDPMRALRVLNVMRHAARVRDLKDEGYSIHRVMVKSREGKTFARYSLAA